MVPLPPSDRSEACRGEDMCYTNFLYNIVARASHFAIDFVRRIQLKRARAPTDIATYFQQYQRTSDASGAKLWEATLFGEARGT